MNRRLRDAGAWLRTVRQLIIAPWPVSLGWFGLLLIAGAVTPFAQIWATTQLVDRLAAQLAAGPAPNLALWAAIAPYLPAIGVLTGAWIASTIFSMNIIQPYVATYHAERVVEFWSRRVLAKSLRLQLDQFEHTAYFDMLQRARAALNAETIAAQHSQSQRIVARAGSCIAIVWAIARVQWLLAVVLVIGSVAITRWRLRRSRTMVAIRHAQAPLQRRRDYWRDLLTQRGAAAEIRMFGLAEYATRQWRALAQQLQEELDRFRFEHLRRELPITIAYVAAFSFGGIGLLLGAQQRRLSPGAFVALLLALQQFLDLMQNFSRIDRIHQVVAELASVPAFLALAGDERATGMAAPAIVSAGIHFNGVGFNYPGSNSPALDQIDVCIRPGERVAMVGENGAGKSTFARLLLGLYRPSAGQILVEGVDLQTIEPAAWRAQAAAVFQDYMRYISTARDNIGFGQPALLGDDAAIVSAACKSGAGDVVAALPHGYATWLGAEAAGGVELSGGQWQKFAIARAYLRDAAVLVLDEPAAALDALAEQEVYRQFLSMSSGKTVLLISHRLGVARLADRIIYLQHGRVAQVGTHDELVRSGGPYAALYELQAAWYRAPEVTP